MACWALVFLGLTSWQLARAAADYEFIDTPMNWNDAQSYCAARNGKLAEPLTADENTTLFNWFGSRAVAFWLGGSDAVSEGSWQWESRKFGTPTDPFYWADSSLNYSNWVTGEPNGGTNENYLMMGSFYSATGRWENRGEWNDGPGSTQIPFVCEYSAKLEVKSSGVSSVVISSSTGHGGTTDYALRGGFSTVTLTAPLVASGGNFTGWSGCSSTGVTNGSGLISGTSGSVCTLTRNTHYCFRAPCFQPDWSASVTANYTPGYTASGVLLVLSSGVDSVAISSSTGHAGTTWYEATTPTTGSSVVLTAPLTWNGYYFTGWTGCDSTSGSSGSVCNTRTGYSIAGVYCVTAPCRPSYSRFAEASYSTTPPYGGSSNPTLYVNATGATAVPISSSTGHSGTTDYGLTLGYGTRVVLTAPTSYGGQVFSHWSGCGSTSGYPVANQCDVTVGADTYIALYCVTSASQLCPWDKRVTAVYTSSSSRLINISTRAKVLTGDHVLIAGFIISGGPKRLLIKAEGPSLSNLGVPGVLSNPKLTLFSGQTPIDSNDDWTASANYAAIQATGKAPGNAREAAVLVTLNPGAYTVIVEGVNAATGIGLVSVEDLDPSYSAGRLVNISSRGYTATGGDEQMIAGFILRGGNKNVLLRGAGPNMAQYGVPNLLPDPVLDLYSGSGVLASNDDWGSSAQAASISVQVNGNLLSKEAAIYQGFAEGAYTVTMRGNGTPGIGLVSVDE